jgi:hypothetical protein
MDDAEGAGGETMKMNGSCFHWMLPPGRSSYLAYRKDRRSTYNSRRVKSRWAGLLALTAFLMAVHPATARSQSVSVAGEYPDAPMGTISAQQDTAYIRPSAPTIARNYVSDTFGPYPAAWAVFAAGVDQANNAPPEWNQGMKGYAKRFGSDFGMASTQTTTRYALSETLSLDPLYYRCACRGVYLRLRHAMVSSFTARRGEDGHRVFSIPSLVAPYAGSMAAVYGWYPNRFGPMDGFRMGNYALLESVGTNIAVEFFHAEPHSLLSRMHLNNARSQLSQGPSK